METIRNYLEAMFANMPRTAEVEKAKRELLQMMEDKYNELLAEGKSENEAVGTVISEFGNLEDLAEALGLEDELAKEHELTEREPRRMLILDEVKDYLQFCGARAAGVALSVALFILSVTGPILFSSLHLPEGIGVVLMFILIIMGVCFLVLLGIRGNRWSYIRKELCAIDYATANYVRQEKQRYQSSFALQLILGIILCASCWLPFLLFEKVGAAGELVATLQLFLMVAAGVFLIIHSSMIKGSFDVILKLNDVETISGSYREGAVPEYASPAAERLMSVYWVTVRDIYLILSFVTFSWGTTWVIWPLAGIIYAILSSAMKDKEGSHEHE